MEEGWKRVAFSLDAYPLAFSRVYIRGKGDVPRTLSCAKGVKKGGREGGTEREREREGRGEARRRGRERQRPSETDGRAEAGGDEGRARGGGRRVLPPSVFPLLRPKS